LLYISANYFNYGSTIIKKSFEIGRVIIDFDYNLRT